MGFKDLAKYEPKNEARQERYACGGKKYPEPNTLELNSVHPKSRGVETQEQKYMCKLREMLDARTLLD